MPADAIRSEHLVALSDLAASGLVVIDADLRVLLWNAWMSDHSGITATDAVGAFIEELLPPSTADPLRRHVRQVLGIGTAVPFDFHVHGALFPLNAERRADGTWPTMLQDCRFSRLAASGAGLVAVSVRDAAEAVAAEADLARVDQALSKGSGKDRHTSILHRREVLDALEDLLAASRADVSVGVLLVDIDLLGTINRSSGRCGGDEVVTAVARVIVDSVRGTDLVGRTDGDEFLVVLPATPAEQALRVAERIRRRVADRVVPWDGIALRATVSVGVASVGRGLDMDTAMDRAEQALVTARSDGRNRVAEWRSPWRSDEATGSAR